MSTTVVIVDDHPAFRRSARNLLELGDFVVVGEAADGAAGAAMVRRLDPDLVILDVGLPDTTGFAVADALAAERADVVLVSSRDRADLEPLVARSPVLGFLTKEQLSPSALRALLGRRS